VNISADKLLKKAFKRVPITNEFELEGLPNRDSLPYAGTYGIEDADTVLRGTLRFDIFELSALDRSDMMVRYPGFSSLMQSFRDIGFLNAEGKVQLNSWADFLPLALGLKPSEHHEIERKLKKRIDGDYRGALYSALQWLSLHGSSSNVTMPPVPTQPLAPLDIFAYLLANRLKYESYEKDMVVLHHEFIVPSNNTGEISKHVKEEEVYTSQLIAYGTSEASAMARTVGIPVALAALLVLDGRVALRGVHGPMDKSVYRPVLNGLEEVGIGMKEEKRVVSVLKPKFETVKQAIASTRF
jgi:alpha-aminoadipic semialdehyde synthase